MKNKVFAVCLFLNAIIIITCTNQNNIINIPVPDEGFYIQDESININNIIQTKNSASELPQWLAAYINGGVQEIEKIQLYNDKYAFIGISEGVNFYALEKWADNFSVEHDFPMLAASRIEKKMINAASLYPDYEYGVFFEKMIKKAYSKEYYGAVKEDTYWIKLKSDDGDIIETLLMDDLNYFPAPSEFYNFFVFIIIDKTGLQADINSMILEAIAEVKFTGNQRNAVNRLRQTFFEGF